MATPPTSRSPDDLRSLSGHVLYEVEMMSRLLQPLAGLQMARLEGGGDQLIENALVESFVMHARGLIEFLFADSAKLRDDDGRATMLVRDPDEWKTARGKKSTLLKTVAQRANKEIAHITFSRKRLTDEAHEWGLGKVYAEVGSVLVAFVPLVPEDHVIHGWHKRMWEALPAYVRGREHFHRPPTLPSLPVATQSLPPKT